MLCVHLNGPKCTLCLLFSNRIESICDLSRFHVIEHSANAACYSQLLTHDPIRKRTANCTVRCVHSALPIALRIVDMQTETNRYNLSSDLNTFLCMLIDSNALLNGSLVWKGFNQFQRNTTIAAYDGIRFADGGGIVFEG